MLSSLFLPFLGCSLVCLVVGLPLAPQSPLIDSIDSNDPLKPHLTHLIERFSPFFNRLLALTPKQSFVSVFEFEESPVNINQLIIDNLKEVIEKHLKLNRKINKQKLLLVEELNSLEEYSSLFHEVLFTFHDKIPFYLVATDKPNCKDEIFAQNFTLYCQFINQLRTFYASHPNLAENFYQFTEMYRNCFFIDSLHSYLSLIYLFSKGISIDHPNLSFFTFCYGNETTNYRLKYLTIAIEECNSGMERYIPHSMFKLLVSTLFAEKYFYKMFATYSCDKYFTKNKELPFKSIFKNISKITQHHE